MDEVSPQLLDLITEHHKDKEVFHMNNNNNNNNNRSCKERKLELRLAPPGVEDWSLHHHTTQNVNPTDDSRFSLGYFSQQPHTPWSSSRPSPSLDLQNAEKKLFSPSQKRYLIEKKKRKKANSLYFFFLFLFCNNYGWTFEAEDIHYS